MSNFLLARMLHAAQAEAAFSDAALLRALLRFETGLAQCQARLGLIPEAAASSIMRAADQLQLDCDQLASDGAHVGSIVIPLLKALRAQVDSIDRAAAVYVHWGSTSQDALDSAMALCTQQAVQALSAQLRVAAQAAQSLAQQHRAAPILAHTLMQPAGVTAFGFKAAQWCLALAEVRQRMLQTAKPALSLSLGGAIGNLAAYGDYGTQLRAALALELGLADAGATWHSLRHRWLALAGDTALASGCMRKIAQDVAFMAQADIGEVSEPPAPGRGGSSAMPHKRNAVLSMRILAATHSVPGSMANLLAGMAQEQERGFGNWQAELAQWPTLFVATHSAAQTLTELLAGLQVDAARCRVNIKRTHGVVFAEALARRLSSVIDHAGAEALCAELCQQALADRVALKQLALARCEADVRLSSLARDALEQEFDADRSARLAGAHIDALLQQAEALLAD